MADHGTWSRTAGDRTRSTTRNDAALAFARVNSGWRFRLLSRLYKRARELARDHIRIAIMNVKCRFNSILTMWASFGELLISCGSWWARRHRSSPRWNFLVETDKMRLTWHDFIVIGIVEIREAGIIILFHTFILLSLGTGSLLSIWKRTRC